MNALPLRVAFGLPDWVRAVAPPAGTLVPDDEARMRLAIRLADENARRRTGGPFGAAVFRRSDGALVAVGVNRVEPERCSLLHAEVMAIALAQSAIGAFTLDEPPIPAHELVCSCEPCAMCLGAAFWSGVRRIVCGAGREDAMALGFDEGPVSEDSYAYLAARGIEVVRGVLREEAARALRLYGDVGGGIYNP
ncbi:MAG TPA: nucleoside deaminase [Chthonomonadales bacterium]|nr:nucleoside deaminase [Chthonomonadales bacterium]